MTTHNVQLCQHEPSLYLDGFLPAWALDKGWKLNAEEQYFHEERIIFVRLRDIQQQTLHAWPEDYWPSLTEIFEKCEEIAKAEATSP
jgi:hypothetical protein